MSSPMDINGSIILSNDTLTFQGSPDLSQFSVLNYQMLPRDAGTRMEVSFTLRRIFLNHLFNTYIPTFGLLLIATVTLQFDNSKMELALSLTLTIMLVMYTMYQSISVAVTSTAYLKLLDYWLFFCLLMPFIIFMIEIYWLLQNNRHLNKSIKKLCWVDDEVIVKRSKNICRFVTYALNLVFVIIYILISFKLYHS